MHPRTGFCQGMQEPCPDPGPMRQGNIQGMQKSDLESCEVSSTKLRGCRNHAMTRLNPMRKGQYSGDAGTMPWPWILWKGGNIQGMQESCPDPESYEEGAILRGCRNYALTLNPVKRGQYSGSKRTIPDNVSWGQGAILRGYRNLAWPWVLWGGGQYSGMNPTDENCVKFQRKCVFMVITSLNSYCKVFS